MASFIYQIHYDEASRKALDPGFIPLQNTGNPRPDWYEFWVIRNFLNSEEKTLPDDAWYGFLSPRFHLKTGATSARVHGFLQGLPAEKEVVLLTTNWDQLSYFLNPFEQGEHWHPGLQQASQQFLEHAGIDLDLRGLVSDTGSSVFSNYMLAKPRFGRAWLRLANALFDYVETVTAEAAASMRGDTTYGNARNLAPLKAFVQERLVTVVLAQGDYAVSTLELGDGSVFTRLFNSDAGTRQLLKACDLLKRQYNLTRDPDHLETYWRLRGLIPTRTKLHSFRPEPVQG